jgi:inner membrane protein
MDTLTHALSGALAARAMEPKTPRPDQLPRRTRLWIGFWAAAFPDSDFIVRFIDPFLYVTTHRGLTHSVVMLPFWALGLALAFTWIYRKRYSWRAFVGVCALGVGAHILGDVITAFGTMVLAPVSGWRAQYPTTFIIDPIFSAILVAGLVAAAVWRDTRRPAVIALAVLGFYIGFQAVLHERALGIGELYASRFGATRQDVHALPQPFSPFHWMIVVDTPTSYHLGYVSLARSLPVEEPPADSGWFRRVFDSYQPPAHARWNRVARFGDEPMEARLAEEVWRSETLAGFRRFAQFPAVYRIDREARAICVWFNDLRFALAGRDLPFRYGGCRTPGENAWRLFQLTNNSDGREEKLAVGIF